jgi:hypothetical protein
MHFDTIRKGNHQNGWSKCSKVLQIISKVLQIIYCSTAKCSKVLQIISKALQIISKLSAKHCKLSANYQQSTAKHCKALPIISKVISKTDGVKLSCNNRPST